MLPPALLEGKRHSCVILYKSFRQSPRRCSSPLRQVIRQSHDCVIFANNLPLGRVSPAEGKRALQTLAVTLPKDRLRPRAVVRPPNLNGRSATDSGRAPQPLRAYCLVCTQTACHMIEPRCSGAADARQRRAGRMPLDQTPASRPPQSRRPSLGDPGPVPAAAVRPAAVFGVLRAAPDRLPQPPSALSGSSRAAAIKASSGFR